jgi:hypothetical protein
VPSLPPYLGEQRRQVLSISISISRRLPHPPLCTGASPGSPPTTTPPSFIGTSPHIGEIHLPCRYFIMLRCRRVHHARRVHRISVNLSMEACPGVSHHRLTVSRANVALALPEPSESCTLPPLPSWVGPCHVGSSKPSQRCCAARSTSNTLWPDQAGRVRSVNGPPGQFRPMCQGLSFNPFPFLELFWIDSNFGNSYLFEYCSEIHETNWLLSYVSLSA